MIHMFRYLSMTSNASNLRMTAKLLLQSFTIVQSCLFTWSQLKKSNAASEMMADGRVIWNK
jgi:hypothetical protein